MTAKGLQLMEEPTPEQQSRTYNILISNSSTAHHLDKGTGYNMWQGNGRLGSGEERCFA